MSVGVPLRSPERRDGAVGWIRSGVALTVVGFGDALGLAVVGLTEGRGDPDEGTGETDGVGAAGGSSTAVVAACRFPSAVSSTAPTPRDTIRVAPAAAPALSNDLGRWLGERCRPSPGLFRGDRRCPVTSWARPVARPWSLLRDPAGYPSA